MHMAISFLELTPKLTLDNLEILETKFGFSDALFRNIHHWGKRGDQTGSLSKHINYLRGLCKDGRSRYKNASSNNYIVAQRIQYIVKNCKTKETIGITLAEAVAKYPFKEC